jgi:hypothetical protein
VTSAFHFTLAGVQQASDQPEQSGFSGAIGAHQCHKLPFFHLQIDPMQYDPLGICGIEKACFMKIDKGYHGKIKRNYTGQMMNNSLNSIKT